MATMIPAASTSQSPTGAFSNRSSERCPTPSTGGFGLGSAGEVINCIHYITCELLLCLSTCEQDTPCHRQADRPTDDSSHRSLSTQTLISKTTNLCKSTSKK